MLCAGKKQFFAVTFHKSPTTEQDQANFSTIKSFGNLPLGALFKSRLANNGPQLLTNLVCRYSSSNHLDRKTFETIRWWFRIISTSFLMGSTSWSVPISLYVCMNNNLWFICLTPCYFFLVSVLFSCSPYAMAGHVSQLLSFRNSLNQMRVVPSKLPESHWIKFKIISTRWKYLQDGSGHGGPNFCPTKHSMWIQQRLTMGLILRILAMVMLSMMMLLPLQITMVRIWIESMYVAMYVCTLFYFFNFHMSGIFLFVCEFLAHQLHPPSDICHLDPPTVHSSQSINIQPWLTLIQFMHGLIETHRKQWTLIIYY